MNWVIKYKAADGTSAHLSKRFSIFSPALFFCDLIFIPPIPAALVPSALLSVLLQIISSSLLNLQMAVMAVDCSHIKDLLEIKHISFVSNRCQVLSSNVKMHPKFSEITLGFFSAMMLNPALPQSCVRCRYI